MKRARVYAVLSALAVGGVIAGWASSLAEPLTDAVKGARDPADFIRDYVTARARLDGGRGAPPSGETANDLGQRLGTPRVLLLGGPYYLHPPPALLAVMPIAWLSWHPAAIVWNAASLAALVWLAISLAGIALPDRPRNLGPPGAARIVLAVLLFVALVFWPPTLHCIEKGQWSIWLAALIAAGYRALERSRPTRAGVLFAIATAVKVTPAALIVLLLARSRRAAGTMLVALFGIGLLALAVNGFALWRAFLAEGPHDVEVWATWLANTASMQGVYARLFTAGAFTLPLVVAPFVAHAAFLVTIGASVVAGLVTWPRRRLSSSLGAGFSAGGGGDLAGDRALACWSAAWLVLPVVLNPLGWTHVVLMLVAPMIVAFRDGGTGTRIGTMFVLAVLSIPRQRLMSWAGPMPVPPGRGLVLGAHAVAAIALYVMLLGDSVRARRDAGFARALRDPHFEGDPSR